MKKKKEQCKIDTKQVVKEEGKGELIENKIIPMEIFNNWREMEFPISQAKIKDHTMVS